MTKEEVKRSAHQLILILAGIEAAGWVLIVLPWIKVIEGPAAIVAMALGVVLVVACLFGAVWTAIQLAKLQGLK